MVTERSETTQVTGWDRGRPARNEREARNQNLRAYGALRAGPPAVPDNRLNRRTPAGWRGSL
jgi:hypothetical protein